MSDEGKYDRKWRDGFRAGFQVGREESLRRLSDMMSEALGRPVRVQFKEGEAD